MLHRIQLRAFNGRELRDFTCENTRRDHGLLLLLLVLNELQLLAERASQRARRTVMLTLDVLLLSEETLQLGIRMLPRVRAPRTTGVAYSVTTVGVFLFHDQAQQFGPLDFLARVAAWACGYGRTVSRGSVLSGKDFLRVGEVARGTDSPVGLLVSLIVFEARALDTLTDLPFVWGLGIVLIKDVLQGQISFLHQRSLDRAESVFLRVHVVLGQELLEGIANRGRHSDHISWRTTSFVHAVAQVAAWIGFEGRERVPVTAAVPDAPQGLVPLFRGPTLRAESIAHQVDARTILIQGVPLAARRLLDLAPLDELGRKALVAVIDPRLVDEEAWRTTSQAAQLSAADLHAFDFETSDEAAKAHSMELAPRCFIREGEIPRSEVDALRSEILELLACLPGLIFFVLELTHRFTASEFQVTDLSRTSQRAMSPEIGEARKTTLRPNVLVPDGQVARGAIRHGFQSIGHEPRKLFGLDLVLVDDSDALPRFSCRHVKDEGRIALAIAPLTALLNEFEPLGNVEVTPVGIPTGAFLRAPGWIVDDSYDLAIDHE